MLVKDLPSSDDVQAVNEVETKNVSCVQEISVNCQNEPVQQGSGKSWSPSTSYDAVSVSPSVLEAVGVCIDHPSCGPRKLHCCSNPRAKGDF